MVGSLNLTSENLNHIVTLPGQAHFAILNGKNTCRECLKWDNRTGDRTPARLLKPARCLKALEHLENPPPIPHSAYACRHFELNTLAPLV
jgi:hypothetical protein